jgi:hypothetical protein
VDSGPWPWLLACFACLLAVIGTAPSPPSPLAWAMSNARLWPPWLLSFAQREAPNGAPLGQEWASLLYAVALLLPPVSHPTAPWSDLHGAPLSMGEMERCWWNRARPFQRARANVMQSAFVPGSIPRSLYGSQYLRKPCRSLLLLLV